MNSPELLNDETHTEKWLIKIESNADAIEFTDLLDYSDYKEEIDNVCLDSGYNTPSICKKIEDDTLTIALIVRQKRTKARSLPLVLNKIFNNLLSVPFFALEATPGFEPGNKGFADLCLTAWLWRHV